MFHQAHANQLSLSYLQLENRLLYGTDWYTGRFLWTEKTYLEWFTRGARRIFWSPVRFSRRYIVRLTDENPRRFLGLPPQKGSQSGF